MVVNDCDLKVVSRTGIINEKNVYNVNLYGGEIR